MELLSTLWNILKNKGINWINTFPENKSRIRTLIEIHKMLSMARHDF
jgi:hypothetical protein